MYIQVHSLRTCAAQQLVQADAASRRGLVEHDIENASLASDFEAGPLDDLLGHSITYRIAVGPRAGQKLFTLQTVPRRLQGLEGESNEGGNGVRAKLVR